MNAPSFRRRNSLRAPEHDYRSPGAYFITICVAGREPVLSRVKDHRIALSILGSLVKQEWMALPDRFPGVMVDALVVMPDHLHGILWLHDAERLRLPTPLWGLSSGSLGVMVGQFKSRVTKAGITSGLWQRGRRLWQRGYHDRMLRSVDAVARARRYIVMNPIRWERDHEGV